MLVATLEGAGDVLIGRCHPGDGHCLNGNHQVQRRVDTLKEILKGVGMDEDRA
ncbi:MAG: hydrogenase iron-sulfur subunit [Anaerolineales bacterium]